VAATARVTARRATAIEKALKEAFHPENATPGEDKVKIRVCAGSMSMHGAHFQPRPSSRAGLLGRGSAMPPRPFSPVTFSAEIERVTASLMRERLPRPMPRPLKGFMGVNC
jgi:hypothetical protein